MANGQIIGGYPEVPTKVAGTATTRLLLLDAVTAVDVGYWMPWEPFRNGSFEVTYPAGTPDATVKLWSSNAAVMPANGFVVTVTGTATLNDVLTVTLSSGSFAGTITASYTVQSGDSVTAMAAGLQAALLAAIAQLDAFGQEQGIGNAAAQLNVTHLAGVLTIKWAVPLQPVTLAHSVSGAITETLTTTQYDSGEGFVVPNCSLADTAANVVFNQPAAWIKASVTEYTSGTITAIVQGTLP